MRSENFVSHVTENRNDPTRGLANSEPGGVQTSNLASEPLAEQWTGIVELAETVLVPPLSGRIARGRVVRRAKEFVIRIITQFGVPKNYLQIEEHLLLQL
jgi:hypothetical protein